MNNRHGETRGGADDVEGRIPGNRVRQGFFGQPFALANLFGVEMWSASRSTACRASCCTTCTTRCPTADWGSTGRGHQHRRRVRRHGVPVDDRGGVVADRLLGSERTLFYSVPESCWGTSAWHHHRSGGRGRRTGADRVRQRRAQGQRDIPRRRSVHTRRRTPGCGFLDLLQWASTSVA